MSDDALYLCREPWCINLVEGGGYCPQHQVPGRANRSGARGYGYGWKKTSQAYLAAHPRCERCHGQATEVHHKDGRRPTDPGANNWQNLKALCHRCHSIEQAELRRLRRAARPA